MSRAALIRRILASCTLVALLAAAVASGRGALVEVDNLVLRADGGFQPSALPRGSFKPIEFAGRATVASKDGSRPLALRQAVIDFDADGRLATRGLPSCAPERIAAASVAQARSRCGGAIVGRGTLGARIAVGSLLVDATSPLTVFNGPRQDGHPTAVLHAQVHSPTTETFAVLAPIERIRGQFRYRVTIDVPPIAAGRGSLTRLQARIGRRYRAGGKRRSYVAARCRDGIIRTRGRFTFEDGTVIAGAVEKFCRSLPSR
jgi:hypothetical protein